MSTSTIVRHTTKELKKMKSKTDWQEIKRRISSGIEPDMSHPNDAEITDEEFDAALAKRKAGRPTGSGQKVSTTVRLDADILTAFRASGRGWQTRLNDALREWLKRHNPLHAPSRGR